jgi:cyanophycin synthetase
MPALPNVTHDLIDNAGANPDRVALCLPQGNISYRRLDQLVWASALHLHEHGVRRGDVVALICHDEALLALAMLGVTRLGATILAIPRSATRHQRQLWTEAAGSRVLVSDHPLQAAVGLGLRVVPARFGPAPTRAGARTELLDEAPSAPIMIRVGSGSIGRPKLMPVSHAQFRARIEQLNQAYANTPDDRILSLSHFEYATPHQRLHGMLAIGGSLALIDRAQDDIASAIGGRGISTVQATVFHVERWLLQSGAPGALSSLRVLTVSSSVVSESLRERVLNGLTPNFHVNYGTNEIGTISLARVADSRHIAGSVGPAIPGVTVEVVDAAGARCAQGLRGSIRIRSPGMIDGYLDDDEANARAFRDGWFHPGDLGFFAPGGELVLAGRADDMMIFNGINIFPGEIEQCLLAHPQVAEAAALAVRHQVHQDVPVCAVVLRPGSGATADDLLAHARDQLGFRGPQRVVLVEAIARNDQGKVQREPLLTRLRETMGPGA